MLDKKRVLSKVDEFDSYIGELIQITPTSFEEYQKIEKKRGCERLLQLAIECTIDICKLLVSGLRLGLPSEENDLFDKLQQKGILSEGLTRMLKEMRGFRNILVHEYAVVDDELVYEAVKTRLRDFREFKEQILKALQ